MREKEKERKKKKTKEEKVQPEPDELDDAQGKSRAQTGGCVELYLYSLPTIRKILNSPPPPSLPLCPTPSTTLFLWGVSSPSTRVSDKIYSNSNCRSPPMLRGSLEATRDTRDKNLFARAK